MSVKNGADEGKSPPFYTRKCALPSALSTEGFNTLAPDSGQKTSWRHPSFAKGHKKRRHAKRPVNFNSSRPLLQHTFPS
jgi:hypothetical protein